MYRYSVEERVFIMKNYWITDSIQNCQRSFVEHFGGRKPLSKRCIQTLVKRHETKGTLFGLSGSTCQRAAKKAGLHAYRFTVVQELKQHDYDTRMTYCCCFQTFIDENLRILNYTWFSDEA
jgi:hypothetical protein